MSLKYQHQFAAELFAQFSNVIFCIPVIQQLVQTSSARPVMLNCH